MGICPTCIFHGEDLVHHVIFRWRAFVRIPENTITLCVMATYKTASKGVLLTVEHTFRPIFMHHSLVGVVEMSVHENKGIITL